MSTNGASALEIGSETVGPFEHILFKNITIRSAGDAALGMAIMDGGYVRNVVYRGINITGAAAPIMFIIGHRTSGHPPGTGWDVGSVRDVLVSGVRASAMEDDHHPGERRNWTALLDGMPPANGSLGSSVGPNVTFEGVQAAARLEPARGSVVAPLPALCALR